ncbi:hypothetical protein EDC15_1473 [Acetobacter aceti NBRC 14818]|uniref:Uncharacterized protein n=1 Tax=Komagataeibacter intermedius NRIC 0521 TaxID=1307934 RepID=A0ABQ0PEV6_9PROT|nr:hypothetical protein EDC15_1473 [Acetobacter aceti NBRC 14818]GBQ65635.1 hypothetical protein AA0521_0509 [Komagataeibacter intermedius NRIC 0521]GBR14201.1 hypothetical protein AA0616_0256 [Komagataeibacter nataicola NRIC 0616]
MVPSHVGVSRGLAGKGGTLAAIFAVPPCRALTPCADIGILKTKVTECRFL